MRLSELFGLAELDYPPALGDLKIDRIVSDSRQVRTGDLYIAIRGLHVDGHDKIGEAINRGAAVIVAERVRDVFVGGAAIVEVENTRSVMALLYNAWYGCPARALRIVGVTGTNGKTSVCWMLSAMFEALGYRTGLIGTVECRSAGRRLEATSGASLANMTTPDPEALYRMLAEMAEDGVDIVFMEVTSHALSLGKCDAIEFDMAVFTNLTQDHLDFHGSMAEYRRAKEKLFSQCRRAVLNADDAVGREWRDTLACPTRTCSVGGVADYTASHVKQERGGFSCCFGTAGGSYPVSLPLMGDFAVINALEASAVAYEYGISAERIVQALSAIGSVPGRMERVVLPPSVPFSVWIDYAHTPDALEKLLESARHMRAQSAERHGRILLVFGCGGERDRTKRRQMARVASRLSDFVIVTSDNSRGESPEQIFSDIQKGIDKEKPHALIRDRREAIRYAVSTARAGDVILLAGKGHETYEIDRTGRHPFDEREIVREAVQAHGSP